jgi:hypothetical protein
MRRSDRAEASAPALAVPRDRIIRAFLFPVFLSAVTCGGGDEAPAAGDKGGSGNLGAGGSSGLAGSSGSGGTSGSGGSGAGTAGLTREAVLQARARAGPRALRGLERAAAERVAGPRSAETARRTPAKSATPEAPPKPATPIARARLAATAPSMLGPTKSAIREGRPPRATPTARSSFAATGPLTQAQANNAIRGAKLLRATSTARLPSAVTA